MKRIVVFALLLNAALLGVIAWQLVTDNHNANHQAYAADKDEILKHMSIEYLPIDDKGGKAKTIRFSGVNVQVVDGTGSTGIQSVRRRQETSGKRREGVAQTMNGLGNLIIGYQEVRSDDGEDQTVDTNDRSGSHNLVVGAANNYNGTASQVVGYWNTISSFLSVVAGGENNTASGVWSVISGGASNTASFTFTTIGGGHSNEASGNYSTISGGARNKALSGRFGIGNTTVSGGLQNTASGSNSTVSGGELNTASGLWSVISGGASNTASEALSAVGGGRRVND